MQQLVVRNGNTDQVTTYVRQPPVVAKSVRLVDERSSLSAAVTTRFVDVDDDQWSLFQWCWEAMCFCCPYACTPREQRQVAMPFGGGGGPTTGATSSNQPPPPQDPRTPQPGSSHQLEKTGGISREVYQKITEVDNQTSTLTAGGVEGLSARIVERANFISGGEEHGAAFAVYHKGKLVVDLWGGYADEGSMRQWTKDTMTFVFSATKGIGAIAIAMLAERGHIHYDDLVSKYWPEFAQNGKSNVTVQMIMDHTAGVPALDQPVSYFDSTERLAKLFQEQKPYWPPGTQMGYHAVTYGWLVDQLVRRADPKQRSVGQFIREEISTKKNNEFFVGLPVEYHSRVARLFTNGLLRSMYEMMVQPRLARIFYKFFINPSPLIRNVQTNPPILVGPRIRFNDPAFYRVEQVAALGIGTARGLARIYDDLYTGKLLNTTSLARIQRPNHVKTLDFGLGIPMPKGWGFMHSKHPQSEQDWLFGHPGHGGQNAKVDLKNGLSFVYLTNTLKLGAGDRCQTFMNLQQALYASIQQ